MAITTIYKSFIFACLLIGVFSQRDLKHFREEAARITEAEVFDEKTLLEAKLMQEQAANATYNFATSLVDGIMDNMQSRHEARNGLNLTGSYAYSDGFFYREVHYIADKDGYRVISELVEPLGDGPIINPHGGANVRTSIAGENFEYNITSADIGQKQKLPGIALA